MKPLHARLTALEGDAPVAAVNPIFIGLLADAPPGTLCCLPPKHPYRPPPTMTEIAEARAARLDAQQSEQPQQPGAQTVESPPAPAEAQPDSEPPRAFGHAKPMGSIWPTERSGKGGRLW